MYFYGNYATLCAMSESSLQGNTTKGGLVAAVLHALAHGSLEEQRMSLEFLAFQTSLVEADARAVYPLVRGFVLGPDAKLRYFARKAGAQLETTYPALREKSFAVTASAGGAFPAKATDIPTAATVADPVASPSSMPLSTPSSKPYSLGQSDILLHKIRLGSPYVAFEAIERLTESGDNDLAPPLLEFLRQETDPFKVSFLVKRLSRLEHPDIAPAIVSFFHHQDPRVVANAIEGLEQLDVPEYCAELAVLAGHSDNRIRGNAVRALHKYDAEAAYNHLRTMLQSSDIAQQDTGVFLLRVLSPPDVVVLRKLALNSKFATIRLRALDVKLPEGGGVAAAAVNADAGQDGAEENAAQYLRGDLWGLAFCSAGAVGLSFLAVQTSRPVATIIFLLLAVFVSFFFRAATLSLPRIVVSLGLVSCMLWGDSRLLVQLAILAVWFPWPRTRNAVTDHRPLLSAWTFAVFAVILSQALQGNLGRILSLLSWATIARESRLAFVSELALRHQAFQGIILAIIAATIIVILHLPRLIVQAAPEEKPGRPFIIAILAGLLLIGALNLAYQLDVRVKLAMHGIGSPEMLLHIK